MPVPVFCYALCDVRWRAGLRETWEDGRAFKELAQRRADVADAKEGIEAARKVSGGGPLIPFCRDPG